MPVLRNVGLAVTCAAAGGQDAIHPIARAALVWDGGRILWIGEERALPAAYASMPHEDAGGRLLIPGLIDCHTHLAFGGWRAEEFERRLRGESYLDIARAGGGIASTVRATRSATADALAARALATLDAMARLGVTTVECKSGYGLDRDTELKLLEVYRNLASSSSSSSSSSSASSSSSSPSPASPSQPLRLVSTFLGAHVVPAEYRDRRQAYIDLLCHDLIPEIAQRGLASFCDVFVEETAFSLDEARTILRAGQAHGLRSKLHADQLHDGGGAALAAEVGAVSADHLEHVSEDGIARMRDAGVVAVSLPIATLYLHAPPMPARRLIEAGVAVAVATDFNPGSAPSYHLPLALTLACTLQRMTPAEALKGATLYAARAIGLEQEIGSLEPGKSADFALIDAPDVTTWLYHFQPNACAATWVRGQRVGRDVGQRVA
jgi:imidazolonepropionase